MTTRVTVTGTGSPPVIAGRAGAGVLVESGDVALQFDAGRATALRIAEAGSHPSLLDAVFLTHHHSDHITGLVDVVFAAWLNRPNSVNLTCVAPNGHSYRFLERMLEPYDEDLAVRVMHSGREYPAPRLVGFDATTHPEEVWRAEGVSVLARTVHHHPVDPAVAYKVVTPDGSVVISGDTRICDEVEDFAMGCDVLVHEAFRVDAFVERTQDPTARTIGDYHSDTVGLGAMAKRAEPGLLMVTHLVPAPRDEADRAEFEQEIRVGGYEGDLVICDDLAMTEFGGGSLR